MGSVVTLRALWDHGGQGRGRQALVNHAKELAVSGMGMQDELDKILLLGLNMWQTQAFENS